MHPFHQFLKNHDPEVILQVEELGDLNAADDEGFSLLQLAARGNHIAVVFLLLSKNVDLNYVANIDPMENKEEPQAEDGREKLKDVQKPALYLAAEYKNELLAHILKWCGADHAKVLNLLRNNPNDNIDVQINRALSLKILSGLLKRAISTTSEEEGLRIVRRIEPQIKLLLDKMNEKPVVYFTTSRGFAAEEKTPVAKIQCSDLENILFGMIELAAERGKYKIAQCLFDINGKRARVKTDRPTLNFWLNRERKADQFSCYSHTTSQKLLTFLQTLKFGDDIQLLQAGKLPRIYRESCFKLQNLSEENLLEFFTVMDRKEQAFFQDLSKALDSEQTAIDLSSIYYKGGKEQFTEALKKLPDLDPEKIGLIERLLVRYDNGFLEILRDFTDNPLPRLEPNVRQPLISNSYNSQSILQLATFCKHVTLRSLYGEEKAEKEKASQEFLSHFLSALDFAIKERNFVAANSLINLLNVNTCIEYSLRKNNRDLFIFCMFKENKYAYDLLHEFPHLVAKIFLLLESNVEHLSVLRQILYLNTEMIDTRLQSAKKSHLALTSQMKITSHEFWYEFLTYVKPRRDMLLVGDVLTQYPPLEFNSLRHLAFRFGVRTQFADKEAKAESIQDQVFHNPDLVGIIRSCLKPGDIARLSRVAFVFSPISAREPFLAKRFLERFTAEVTSLVTSYRAEQIKILQKPVKDKRNNSAINGLALLVGSLTSIIGGGVCFSLVKSLTGIMASLQATLDPLRLRQKCMDWVTYASEKPGAGKTYFCVEKLDEILLATNKICNDLCVELRKTVSSSQNNTAGWFFTVIGVVCLGFVARYTYLTFKHQKQLNTIAENLQNVDGDDFFLSRLPAAFQVEINRFKEQMKLLVVNENTTFAEFRQQVLRILEKPLPRLVTRRHSFFSDSAAAPPTRFVVTASGSAAAASLTSNLLPPPDESVGHPFIDLESGSSQSYARLG